MKESKVPGLAEAIKEGNLDKIRELAKQHDQDPVKGITQMALSAAIIGEQQVTVKLLTTALGLMAKEPEDQLEKQLSTAMRLGHWAEAEVYVQQKGTTIEETYQKLMDLATNSGSILCMAMIPSIVESRKEYREWVKAKDLTKSSNPV